MKKVQFDIGYGVTVDSLHCQKCGFNLTQDKKLKNALGALREQMSKPVKLVRIGTGIGVRFSNEVVKNYGLKAGEKVLLKPEMNGIKFVVEP